MRREPDSVEDPHEPALPAAPNVCWAGGGAFPPAGAQCVTQSCVGWAVGYHAMSWLVRREPGARGRDLADPRHQISPSWIYNYLNDGDGGLGLGSIEIAGRLLTAQGACSMEAMPFTCDPAALPTSAARAEAAASQRRWSRHRLALVRFLRRVPLSLDLIDPGGGEPTHVVTQVTTVDWAPLRRFLSTQGPVVLSAKLPPSFFTFRGRGSKGCPSAIYLPEPGEQPSTAHAMVVVAMSDTFRSPRGRGAYCVLNSQGTTWGSNGYAWIPYAVFREWSLARALDSAIALAWNPEKAWKKWLDVRSSTTTWRYHHSAARIEPSDPARCPCPALRRDFSHCPKLVGRTTRIWHTPAQLEGVEDLVIPSPPFPDPSTGVRAEALILVSGAANPVGTAPSRPLRGRRPNAAKRLRLLPRVGRRRRLVDRSVVQLFRVPRELVATGELTIDLRLIRGDAVISRELVRLPEWPGPDPAPMVPTPAPAPSTLGLGEPHSTGER